MIEPYFKTENGKLYHADCIEVLPYLDPVDLVLTDPPFGIGNFVQINGKIWRDGKKVTWNDNIPDPEIFKLIRKLGKHRIIWGANYFNCFDEKGGAIVWIKGQKLPNCSKAEIASCSFYKKIEIVRVRWDPGIAKSKKRTKHPCERPVDLYTWCMDYSPASSTILDPFMGSGSIAVACELSNRQWIGIEKSEEYCEMAAKRIDLDSRQLQMFVNCKDEKK
jgi:DNA modification methylase